MRRFLFSSRCDATDRAERGGSAVSRQAAHTALLAGRSPCWWGALRCSRSPRSPALWRAPKSAARSPKPKPHTPESQAPKPARITPLPMYKLHAQPQAALVNTPSPVCRQAPTRSASRPPATGTQYYSDENSLSEAATIVVASTAVVSASTPKWWNRAPARSRGGHHASNGQGVGGIRGVR